MSRKNLRHRGVPHSERNLPQKKKGAQGTELEDPPKDENGKEGTKVKRDLEKTP